MVLCCGAAGLDAEGAALGLELAQQLGELDPDLSVVGADVGESQLTVFDKQVGVPK